MRGNVNTAVRTASTTRRLGRGVAAAAGLVACAGIVWTSSHATFTSTTSNDGNTVSAGTVAISDNDGGSSKLFNTSGIAPGDAAVSSCIAVTYTGSLTPTAIKMYFPITGTNKAQESDAGGSYVDWADSDASEMDKYTTLHVEVNTTDLTLTNPTFNDCTPASNSWQDVVAATPLQTLIKNNNTYAGTSLASPAIAQGKWRIFRFTYELPASASPQNGAQGDGVKFGVNWEAQR
ncbi:hypothetical protein OWR29_18840 [Actinoplanes sp. Pm04-4]|uniref:Uncharacterized protein n=1 Tax=Paractinoplanes pyxinae TaxID=2997416 RepID=A0ABT4B1W6_9ACTN|nr:hypothetical protein [Actinoplanes pyxinae]MCY1140067.1 hypothetical protein [Actinoplanes pyxinae]